MDNITVKFKKTHPDAVLPGANNKEPGTGDTGYDLTAVEDVTIHVKRDAVVPVGLTLAFVTPGYWLRIEPRSGLGFKHGVQPHLGVIDNGYRGDLAVKLYNFGQETVKIKKGDRIAQLVVYELLQPRVEFTEEIEESARGDKGFGSSDLSPDMQEIKDQTLRVKSSDDWWSYADAFTEQKITSGEYIPNPMKVDQSDPDYIKNPDYKPNV